jgi:hypothetical protein
MEKKLGVKDLRGTVPLTNEVGLMMGWQCIELHIRTRTVHGCIAELKAGKESAL